MKRREDWANLVLGIWLLFAPSIFGLTHEAAWTTYGVGTAVAIGCLWELDVSESNVAEWFNFWIGGYYFVSPWIFGYADESSAAWNAWLVGAAVALLAALALPMSEKVHLTKHAPVH